MTAVDIPRLMPDLMADHVLRQRRLAVERDLAMAETVEAADLASGHSARREQPAHALLGRVRRVAGFHQLLEDEARALRGPRDEAALDEDLVQDKRAQRFIRLDGRCLPNAAVALDV